MNRRMVQPIRALMLSAILSGIAGTVHAADPLKPLTAPVPNGALHYEAMGGGDDRP